MNVLKNSALIIYFGILVTSVHASDEGGVDRIFSSLQGHITYDVSEPRTMEPQAKKYDRMTDTPMARLCYEIDKFGIYEEARTKSLPFSALFKGPSLELRKYSERLSRFWFYMQTYPPAFSSCFKLGMTNPQIDRLNGEAESSFVFVCNIKDKPYLSLGPIHAAIARDGFEAINCNQRLSMSASLIDPEGEWIKGPVSYMCTKYGIELDSNCCSRTDFSSYLIYEAFSRTLRTQKQKNLFPADFLASKGIVNRDIPEITFRPITSFRQAYFNISEITPCYSEAIDEIERWQEEMEPAWYVINEDEDNRARINLLEKVISHLSDACDHYKRVKKLLLKSHRQIVRLIEDAGPRNQACIHDPLFDGFVRHLQVPSVDRHLYLNTYWHKIVDCTLEPIFKSGVRLVSDVNCFLAENLPMLAKQGVLIFAKYVLPTAFGIMFVAPMIGLYGCMYYYVFIKAGYTSHAIGLAVTTTTASIAIITAFGLSRY